MDPRAEMSFQSSWVEMRSRASVSQSDASSTWSRPQELQCARARKTGPARWPGRRSRDGAPACERLSPALPPPAFSARERNATCRNRPSVPYWPLTGHFYLCVRSSSNRPTNQYHSSRLFPSYITRNSDRCSLTTAITGRTHKSTTLCRSS